MLWRITVAILLISSSAFAQSVISTGGAEETIGSGAQVILSPAGYQVGGRLVLSGASTGSLALLTSGVTAGVPVSVVSGGTIDFKFGRLESVSSVSVAAGGRIDRLHDSVFIDLAGLNPGATPWVDLSALGAADRANVPFSFNRVTFSDPQGTPTRLNIKSGAATPIVRLLGNAATHGNRWGETFNSDTAGVIRWYTGAVTRTSPAGTYDTVEDALKASGTVAGSTITVTLGHRMIDDVADFNTLPSNGAGAAGPIVVNACLAPMLGKAVFDGDADTTRRGKIVNCIVARGAIEETTAENCTFFDPAGVIAVNNIAGTNCLLQSGYSGTGSTFTTSLTTATSAFFLGSATYNFHLASPGGVTAIDEGTTLTTATDVESEPRGFDGKAGGAGTWDIGADEFVTPVVTTASGSTNDNTPLVQANATTGRIVNFYRTGTIIGTSTAAGGTVSLSDPTPQVDGVYTYATAYDLGEGTAGPLSTTTAVLTIDTVVPGIASVSSTTGNGAYPQGAVINVTVTFTEQVTLAGGNLRVTLNTGTVVSITPFGPSLTALGTYTVTAGQNTADLTATSPLTLSAGTLRDAAANNSTLTIPAGQNLGNLKDIVIDTTIPAISSVSSTTADGTYGEGASINVTVTFSEPVTLSGGNLLVTLVTSPNTVITIPPFGPANTAVGTYVVVLGQSSPDLTAISPLTLSAGTLRDPAGNNTTLTIPGTQNIANLKAIIIDTSTPSVTSVTSTTANGTYGFGASINIKVNFSEPVTLAGGNLLVALNTGVTVVIAPFGPANTASGTYIVGAGESTPDLNATSPLTLSAGTLNDGAGHVTTKTIPAGQNLADLKAIVIDGGPLPPTNVRTISYSTAVDVFWDPSPSSGVQGYNVYRKLSTDGSWPGTPLNSAGVVTNTRYRDTGLTNGLIYQYRVTAVKP